MLHLPLFCSLSLLLSVPLEGRASDLWDSLGIFAYIPADDKTYNKTCVISKYSDQPVHLPSMASVLVYPTLDSGRL